MVIEDEEGNFANAFSEELERSLIIQRLSEKVREEAIVGGGIAKLPCTVGVPYKEDGDVVFEISTAYRYNPYDMEYIVCVYKYENIMS